MPKHLQPDEMTPDQRNREVADLFARAFLRTHFPALSPAPAQTTPTAQQRVQQESPSTQKSSCNQN